MKCFGYLSATAFRIYGQDGTLKVKVPEFGFALVNESDGVLSLPNGELISVQPDGSVQTRPAGAVGPWETGVVDGGIITYTPDPSSGVAWVFGLRNA